MSTTAAPTALDVAVWFRNHAQNNGWLLEAEKLQHLLFLAQIHYILLNNGTLLMPATFVCNNTGFSIPDIAKLNSVGQFPSFSPAIDEKTQVFLEIIWKKYAPMSLRELSTQIKSSPAYTQNFHPGQDSLTDMNASAPLFKSGLGKKHPLVREEHATLVSPKQPQRKILISQNGPVVVSQWQPRKLSNKETKEMFNA